MARLDNAAVVKSFLNREAAESHTRNLWTDGKRLMSYYTCIAEFVTAADFETMADYGVDKLLLINNTRYSMTTSAKHQSPLRHALDRLAASADGSRYTDGGDIVSVHHLAGIRRGTESLCNMVKHGDGTYWQ